MRVILPVLVLLFILLPLLALSQPGGPGGGDPDVPITGIEFLLGGGLFLGLKKIISQAKSKKE